MFMALDRPLTQAASADVHAVWSPRAWTPALRLSALIHGVALLGVVLAPRHWPVFLGLFAANHLLLFALTLWPRGRWIGANLTRLPHAAAARGEIALTFDDGPDPRVTPQVLELLARHRARASFFCIAERAAAHPALVREILRCGHSIENHSDRHAYSFAARGWFWTVREVRSAQERLTALCGEPPRFFRAPAGFRNPLLDPILARLGLRYVSWTRRGYDSVRGDADAVLRRLTRGLAAGDILLLHDGDPARTREGVPVVLEVLPRLLEKIEACGLKPVPLPSAFDG